MFTVFSPNENFEYSYSLIVWRWRGDQQFVLNNNYPYTTEPILKIFYRMYPGWPYNELDPSENQGVAKENLKDIFFLNSSSLFKIPPEMILGCGIEVFFSSDYLWVMSPFLCFIRCVNLIRVFLHDDTLHYLDGLHASWTFLVLQQQQNLGRRFGTSKMHLSPPVA